MTLERRKSERRANLSALRGALDDTSGGYLRGFAAGRADALDDIQAERRESREAVLEETGWLVELRSYGKFEGWLHGGEVDHGSTLGWTTDPNKALRFCRKEDADAFRVRYGFTWSSEGTTHLSTDHVWLGALQA